MVVTEIDCHECKGTFSVDFDVTKNGNHVVKCPKCGHEHCRVIKNGEVTDDRWDSRNGPTSYYRGYGYYQSTTTASYGRYYSSNACSSTGGYLGSWTEYRSI